MDEVSFRQAAPDDHDKIVPVLNDWWGREVAAGLPRLFLQHFHSTSLVAEQGGDLIGFLIGFVSPSQPAEAYIHYVGIHPGHRRSGLARHLYGHFLSQPSVAKCAWVRAITSPLNAGSIEFHEHMGFDVSDPVVDYNGPGRDMVVLTRALHSS
jgi:ribosomal protein S18 acetylase RimI-like enzyme